MAQGTRLTIFATVTTVAVLLVAVLVFGPRNGSGPVAPVSAAAAPGEGGSPGPEVELIALEQVTRARTAGEAAGPGDASRDSRAGAQSGARSADALRRARLEGTAAWLRRVLPDRLGSLTPEEAEMLLELDLRGAEIADADLAHLASLTHLRSLSLRGTPITDAGVAHLWGLHQLRYLELRGTELTGMGLQHLPGAGLEALHLTGTKVTGDDLDRLTPMPNLKVLKLNFLEVGDAALESLAAHPGLRHIELDQTGITDGGLERLLELNPLLTRLELRNTAVTADKARELATRYPGCEFVLDVRTTITVHR